MSYTLTIRHSGIDHVFDADMVEESDYATSESAGTDTVEIGDVELYLDETLFSATAIDDLPFTDGSGVENWRAKLEHGATLVMNGVIPRETVRYEPAFKRWHVTVRSDGVSAFTDALEAVILGDATGPIDADLIEHLPADPTVEVLGLATGSQFNNLGYTRECYRIDAVWEAVLSKVEADASITFVQPEGLFSYPVHYNDGEDKTITRTPIVAMDCLDGEYRRKERIPRFYDPSVPAWSGKDLFEAIQAMHAWVLRAEYATYPSREITVTAIPGTWQTPSDPPNLTGLVEEEGLELYAVPLPELPDLGVTFHNDYHDIDVLNWRGDPYVHSELYITGEYRNNQESYVPPGTMFIYQAETLKFDPDGRPDNDNLIRLQFALPWISDPVRQADETPDPSNHPDYNEDVLVARNYVAKRENQGRPHLFEVVEHPSSSDTYRVLINRKVLATRQTGQPQFVSSISPFEVIRRHEIARSRIIELEAAFDHTDVSLSDYVVGDSGEGVEFDSHNWIVTRREFRPGMKSAALTLRREDGVPLPDPTSGGSDGLEIQRPSEFTGAAVCDENEWDFELSWTAPNGGEEPVSYEIEWWPFWASSMQPLVTTGDLSYNFSVEANIERGNFLFRIRSIGDDPGDGVPEVSEWRSLSVEAPFCGGGVAPGNAGIFVTPPIVDWGTVFLLEELEETITITSIGDETLYVVLIELEGADAADMTLTPDPSAMVPIALPPGEDTQFLLEYTVDEMAESGPVTAYIYVWSNAYGMNLVVVPITAWISPWDLIPCFVTDAWYYEATPCAPYAANEDAVFTSSVRAFDIGSTVYIIARKTGEASSGVWQYDYPDAMGGGNEYTYLEDLPSSNINGWRCAETGGKIYLLDGAATGSGGSRHFRFWSWEPGVGFTELDSMPASVSPTYGTAGQVFALGGDIYHVGGGGFSGSAGSRISDQYSHVYSSGSWDTAPAPPYTIYEEVGLGHVDGGVLFVGGRWVEVTQDVSDFAITHNLDEVWLFNGSTFTQLASLPEYRQNSSVAQLSHGAIHIIGGHGPSPVSAKNTNWRYDAVEGVSETTFAVHPVAVTQAGVLVKNDLIFNFHGGTTASPFYTQRLHVYHPPEGGGYQFEPPEE